MANRKSVSAKKSSVTSRRGKSARAKLVGSRRTAKVGTAVGQKKSASASGRAGRKTASRGTGIIKKVASLMGG